ncbi:MAG TPA: DUF3047 domain-containing protein [Ramlibacter sp.]|nr:DUF3047 domain-containing protein [Ramlibacter sp.]
MACATAPRDTSALARAWGEDARGAVGATPASWDDRAIPGKAASRYRYTVKDGRHAVLAEAQASASLLRRKMQVSPDALGLIRFSWLVPSLIAQADLSRRDQADSPVRVMLAFDGDRSRLSAKDAMMSELARTLTGEDMPFATLMYVWANEAPRETVIRNPRTDRVRKIVVESGSSRLHQWLDYERDIRADYERAFGEPPGALIGIAIMTDADNTRSAAKAWYGPLRLAPALTARR